MLDIKKVGIKICSFRKKIGYSQEKLAELLCISPQAISRWENGHTLPNTQTLPMLAQIFGCTIDEIIMPAYAFDEKIEANKPDALEQQAEQIANIILKKMENKNMGNENHGNKLFNQYMLHTEDNYFKGNCFNEDTENGKIYRENLNSMLRATAELHSLCWENTNAFEQIGLPWHFEETVNMLAWVKDAMEKPFEKYRKKETMNSEYYYEAMKYVVEEYLKIIDSRFKTGKNITVVHGDLHPGNTFMSKSADRTVKFTDLKNVRIGLCTEDLVMLLALHIEPEREKVEPLLKYYHDCLCEKVKDYTYETFINDYKLSVAENMFFPIRLINRGINDCPMRDRAVKAFETFVLNQ